MTVWPPAETRTRHDPPVAQLVPQARDLLASYMTGRSTRHLAAMAVLLLAVACAPATAAPVTPSPDTREASTSSPATLPTPTPAKSQAVAPSPAATRTAAAPTPPGVPGPPTASAGMAPIGEAERARVLDVIDGDTIAIDRGQGREKVRYIGVDTPETVHPSKPVEVMGREASAANKAMVEGRDVLLERDVTDRDRYGRLLRYVWIEDPSSASGLALVNLALVAGGFAQVSTYPPDVRYVDLYLAAQRQAREAGLGLWADEPPGSPETTALPAAGGGGCDPAYPDVCIPPSPPDLDCGDVPYRSFTVKPPDPHRFDGNGDGVGCESP